jgi:hypothetical protein
MPKGSEIVVDSQNKNQIVGTRKTGMDEAAVDRNEAQEDASKRLSAKLKAAGGADDTPPVKGENESLPAFSERNKAYRARKQAAQAAALR